MLSYYYQIRVIEIKPESRSACLGTHQVGSALRGDLWHIVRDSGLLYIVLRDIVRSGSHLAAEVKSHESNAQVFYLHITKCVLVGTQQEIVSVRGTPH